MGLFPERRDSTLGNRPNHGSMVKGIEHRGMQASTTPLSPDSGLGETKARVPKTDIQRRLVKLLGADEQAIQAVQLGMSSTAVPGKDIRVDHNGPEREQGGASASLDGALVVIEMASFVVRRTNNRLQVATSGAIGTVLYSSGEIGGYKRGMRSAAGKIPAKRPRKS
ncbi:hypothetical protein BCR33DRAFT_775110 [Rhizoclosmatium globosum]|uniref:Uncharacterized protein n=1 Tax=Rhizoclosmatium globosum TaxID=329046 RepID=A0A1Y2AN20_9FUNG|nr:hypothetical protein BCR33DRAFT_775110 [Rhizoclosmatium globosum]|eukprot:ORY23884.1 hypothetical protein BCR33DRAFT_775110 [Rhizoclosmatium globosum]